MAARSRSPRAGWRWRRRLTASWSGSVEVRNQGSHPATYDLLTLAQAYGVGEENRRARFFGSGQAGLIQEGWAIPEVTSFSLAAGAARVIRLTAKPSHAVKPADQVDEVLFLARRAEAADPQLRRRRLNGMEYNRSELLRLRYGDGPPAPAASGPKP